MPKLDIPPEGPELTWHTMRDWLYKLWLNVKGLTFGADSSTYSSAILATAGQSDMGASRLLPNAISSVGATTTNALSVANNTAVTVTNWTTSYNIGGNFTASTGVFTCTKQTQYDVRAAFRFSAGAMGAGTQCIVQVAVNGTAVYQAGEVLAAALTVAISTTIATIVMCNPGDTITVRVFQNSGATQTLDGNGMANWLTIRQCTEEILS